MSLKNVVIVGGHGNVSLRLARILAPQGHTVTSLIRNADHADDILATGAQPLLLSLEESTPAQLAETLTELKADVVYFSAGAGGKGGEEHQERRPRRRGEGLRRAGQYARGRHDAAEARAGVGAGCEGSGECPCPLHRGRQGSLRPHAHPHCSVLPLEVRGRQEPRGAHWLQVDDAPSRRAQQRARHREGQHWADPSHAYHFARRCRPRTLPPPRSRRRRWARYRHGWRGDLGRRGPRCDDTHGRDGFPGLSD